MCNDVLYSISSLEDEGRQKKNMFENINIFLYGYKKALENIQYM